MPTRCEQNARQKAIRMMQEVSDSKEDAQTRMCSKEEMRGSLPSWNAAETHTSGHTATASIQTLADDGFCGLCSGETFLFAC
jgi:hypothetical protein